MFGVNNMILINNSYEIYNYGSCTKSILNKNKFCIPGNLAKAYEIIQRKCYKRYQSSVLILSIMLQLIKDSQKNNDIPYDIIVLKYSLYYLENIFGINIVYLMWI